MAFSFSRFKNNVKHFIDTKVEPLYDKVADKITASPSTHTTQTVEPPVPSTPQTTTKIYLPDGNVITHQGASDQPLSLANLQYRKPLVANAVDTSNQAEVIRALEKYVAAHPAQANSNLAAAYQPDSDGDGIIDRNDQNPNMWNVTDRDLRLFSALAYSNENTLNEVFTQPQENTINALSRANNLTTEELTTVGNHWDLLKFGNPSNDLEYAIFGNGKNADGSYQNVVVAFRGSENAEDYATDLRIVLGDNPANAAFLEGIAQEVAAYRPEHIYATGHSLGGYLAQYFVTHNLQNTTYLENFEHSALFNPLPIGSLTQDSRAAKALTEEFTATVKQDNSDLTDPALVPKTASYVIDGEFVSDGLTTAQAIALGVTTGALTGLLTGGFSWLSGGTTAYQAMKGLGTYNNSIILDINQADSNIDRHRLKNFHSENDAINAYFSKGYRVDAHTSFLNADTDRDGLTDVLENRIGTNVNAADSDGDGFNDLLEAQLGADPLLAHNTPQLANFGLTDVDTSPIEAVVETTDANGATHYQSVTLNTAQQGDQLVYTPSSDAPVDLGTSYTPTAETVAPQAVVTFTGTAGDDVITGSAGQDVLAGGEGKDLFVFNHAPNGTVDQLVDFSAEDQIGLAKEIFTSATNDLNNWANYLKYNAQSGEISYDSDGTGDLQAVVFAQISANFDLQQHHFAVV